LFSKARYWISDRYLKGVYDRNQTQRKATDARKDGEGRVISRTLRFTPHCTHWLCNDLKLNMNNFCINIVSESVNWGAVHTCIIPPNLTKHIAEMSYSLNNILFNLKKTTYNSFVTRFDYF